jgi:hypothetical protein
MLAVSAIALAAALAGAHPSDMAPPAGKAPAVVTITATDFAFQAPDTLEAGATTFRLANMGKEMHHAFLIRLEQGKTPRDLAEAMKGGDGPFPTWAVPMGGPNTSAPGSGLATEATVDLVPGRYLMLCVIPSPDGVPHLAKGMSKEFVVVPAKGETAKAPAPTLTMRLTDYAFELSKPLTAGRHVIRVVNEAEQPHEVVIARLAPGKTAADLAAWVEKQDGPPPAMPVGGTVGMAKGVVNDVPLEVAPGEYALLCFIPDAKDGKPHVAHGMLTQLSVK